MGSRRIGVRRVEALVDNLLDHAPLNGINGSQFVLCDPDRFHLEEYFARRPALNTNIAIAFNLDFELLGANAANANVTYSTTTTGLKLSTAGADDDAMIVLPHLDSNQTAWSNTKFGTENQVQWECLLRTDASIADMTWYAGLKLTNTDAYATDDDQAYFLYSSNDDSGALTTNANLHFVYSIGGTDFITDLGIPVAAATTYRLAVSIDSDRKASVFVDGVQYSVVTTSTAGGAEASPSKGVVKTPALTNDVDLIPYLGVVARTSSAKALIIIYEKISRIVFE
jgi:hypothetical protein